MSATEKTLDGVNILLSERREFAAGETAQISALETIVDQIQSGSIEVDVLREKAESSKGSLFSSYLTAYTVSCSGQPADYTSLEKISGNNKLALALASIAFSSGQLEDTKHALRFCDFDQADFIKAINKFAELPLTHSSQIEIRIPATPDINTFIDLINFETLFKIDGFTAAKEYAETNSISWNPIAAEKYLVSDLFTASLFKDDVATKATIVAESYRQWFSEELTSYFKSALSAAFIEMTPEAICNILSGLDDSLTPFAEDEAKSLELRQCNNIESVSQIAIWAEAKKNAVLLLEASIKAIDIDRTTKASILERYERCQQWAFPTMGILSVYISKIHPDIDYDLYCQYGTGKEHSPQFHFVASKILRDKNPVEADSHIEHAIELMHSSNAIDFLNSDIWVPYLIQNGQESRIVELVEKFLPLASYEYVMTFLSAIDRSKGSSDIFDSLAKSTIGSKFKDPRTSEFFAQHLASKGQSEIAGRNALASFKKVPSEISADIAYRWMLENSLPVPEEILNYAKKVDSPRMNILLANCAEEDNDPEIRNEHLIRAAFTESDESSRALILYAIQNTNQNEQEIPRRIGADTYAITTSKDNSIRIIIFLSNRKSVKQEGAKGPAGIAFSTSSSEYLRCRNAKVGDVIRLDDENLTVTEIGLASTILSRIGFKELEKSSYGTVFTGTPEELFEKITEHAKVNTFKTEIYKNGFTADNGIVYYFGIETGARCGNVSQLEFILTVVSSPSWPYRKHPISRNVIAEQEKYLLSYNSIVVLSLLSLPDKILNTILNRVVITESTHRRLSKDVKEFMDEPFNSVGRLSVSGGGPIFYEFNDESIRYTKEKGLPILDLLARIETITPSITPNTPELIEVLNDNEVIDITTASDNNFVFVTEDITEAQLIDAFEACYRHSIASMLASLGHGSYVFQDYASHMNEWGAEPAIEHDLIDAFIQAAKDTLSLQAELAQESGLREDTPPSPKTGTSETTDHE